MHIHIVGICGTFMGGVAQLAAAAGHRVTGCDANVYPPMSDQLRAAGIDLIEGFSVDQLALKPDLYVIGNAISRGNELLEAVLNEGLPYTSGPQWLGQTLLPGKHVLTVAGTHGKTTTSSMLAWILEANGYNPGFLIGGVPSDFGHSARLTDSNYFVIEGDEYDTCFFDKRSKFVHYRPKTAILNNLEFDHADIFEDLHAIETQFHHLVRTMAQNARVVVNGQSDALARVLARGLYSQCEFFNDVRGWHLEGADVFCRDQLIGTMNIQLPGHHNALNALAAIVASTHVGIEPEAALNAMKDFCGVKRRLELRGIERNVAVYDDFAHHPTAIRETIAALKQKLPKNAKVVAVFEPRSNTMKMGTMKEALPESFSQADVVICYADPKLGWDAQAALSPLGAKLHVCHSIEETVNATLAVIGNGDAVLVMSNGAFGGIHGKLLAALKL